MDLALFGFRLARRDRPGRRVMAHFGGLQDIEWAIAEGQLLKLPALREPEPFLLTDQVSEGL